MRAKRESHFIPVSFASLVLKVLITATFVCIFKIWSTSLAFGQEVIELKYADWNPPTLTVAQVNQAMLNRITERTKGKVRFVTFFSETLLKMPEVYRGVQTGVADMAYFGLGIPGSPAELGRVLTLPFMGITSVEMGTKAMSKLWTESPELQAEFKGVKVFGFRAMPLEHLMFTNKLAKIPADVRGQKILAVGLRIEYVKSLGAAPVAVGPGEWYLALERGLANGFYQHFAAAYNFKLLDILKYYTILNINTGFDCFAINERTWSKLSPEVRSIILEEAERRAQEMIKADYGEESKGLEYAKQKGGVFYNPTQDEMKLWISSAEPVHKEWIEKYEQRGLPARKIYERAKAIIQSVK